MNEITVEIKLELVISRGRDINVKVKSIGGGVSKRVENGANAVSLSHNAPVSFASSDGSYLYREIPLALSLVSLPAADNIEPNSGGEISGTEVIENSNS